MRDRTVTTGRECSDEHHTTVWYLLEGLIYQLHILLKYFFQGGKTHSVTGLWALSLALGQWVMLPTLQINEDTGGRQRRGCKNTQLLLGDILHPLLRKFQRGQRGKQSQNQVTGVPVSLKAWMTLERVLTMELCSLTSNISRFALKVVVRSHRGAGR